MSLGPKKIMNEFVYQWIFIASPFAPSEGKHMMLGFYSV